MLDRFRRPLPFDRYDTFRITEQGREKVQDYRGRPADRILVALESEGGMDIKDLSSNSGISVGHLEHLLPALIRGGYIATTGAVE